MISVVIPLYNKESIIERSLQSVLSQDYDDFEVVVVNDGSTDRSMEIVHSIEDHRLVLIEQENGGPSKARNTGVKNAKGEWIVFLDADDELLPGALHTFTTLIETHRDCDFIICPFYINNGQGKETLYDIKKGRITNPFKVHCTGGLNTAPGSFVSKKQLFVNNPFNEELRRYEDLEQLLRLYNEASIFAGVSPTVSINGQFASASKSRKDINEDFMGHLTFSGKGFWERMLLFDFFLGERPLYPEQCRKLYPHLYHRYDLLILTKILNIIYKKQY